MKSNLQKQQQTEVAPVHTKQAYRGNRGTSHTLTLALVGGEWPTSRARCEWSTSRVSCR